MFQLSYSVCSFDAFDIADPSTRQTACHKWIAKLTIDSLWLSGRVSERGV